MPTPDPSSKAKPPVNWFSNSLAGLLLLVGGLTLGVFGGDFIEFEYGSMSDRLGVLWRQDFQTLQRLGRLPSGFAQIGKIDVIAANGDPLAKTWKNEIEVPIAVNPKEGLYRLEVLLLSWTEGRQKGAIIQYDLMDMKTDNLLWELGRSFTLNDEKPPADATSPLHK